MPRNVVITGASSGIGAELARLLSKRGDRLVLAARREAELRAVADACGPNAIAVPTDVTRRSDVDGLREAAIARFGHVDVWINNAGRGIHKHVMELADEDVDEILDVNLRSALYGMQAIVPHFQARGRGHLVNVSSTLGRLPVAPRRSIYSAAKAALNILTSDLRADLRATHPGIVVSLVLPGTVASDFPTKVRGQSEPHWAVGQQAGPMKVQSVEEVAGQIAELLDDPRPELYTNPAAAELVARYYADVAAFEISHSR